MFQTELFRAAVVSHMHKHAYSEREMARFSGVSISTISRIVNGKAPDIHTFASLIRFMDVNANVFLDHMPPEQGYELVELDDWVQFYLLCIRLHIPDDVAKAVIQLLQLIVSVREPR